MVDVVYAEHAALACAISTKCAAIRRLGVEYTFDKRESASIRGRKIRLKVTDPVQGGKYGAGIVYYFSFFLWRHHGMHIIQAISFDTYNCTKSGSADRGGSFVLVCLFGTFYSIYSCSWVGFCSGVTKYM
jgi:hypothetical protein